jgi:hypothetical protein
MLEVLQTKQPEQHAAIMAATPPNGWRLLLSNEVLATAAVSRRARRGELHQQQQQQQQQLSRQQQQLQQLQQTSAWAVADFVMEAWKVRNTALNGRGANGGDAMA